MSQIRSFTVEGKRLVLYVSSCGECGVVFGVPDQFDDRRRIDGKTFYCPNGHGRIYTETDSTRLAATQAKLTATNDQLSAAIRENELTRTTLLKERTRFAKGVCPCCNRSFENVRRHMGTQHPEYPVPDAGPLWYACSCGRKFETLHGLHIHQARQRPTDWDRPNQSRYSAHLTKV